MSHANLVHQLRCPDKEFFIDNLLVRIHNSIVMIKWTGLAPWEFEFPFPGSLTSTFLEPLTPTSSTSSGANGKYALMEGW
jgi:hypothetical protein